jgi:hypothetical protein
MIITNLLFPLGQISNNMILVSERERSRDTLVGLTFEVTRGELKRMVHRGNGVITMEILLWA